MELLWNGSSLTVAWFPVLLAVVFVVAIATKSMLANIGLIVTAGLGIDFGLALSGVGDTFQYVVVAVMLCLIGFALFQMLGRTETI